MRFITTRQARADRYRHGWLHSMLSRKALVLIIVLTGVLSGTTIGASAASASRTSHVVTHPVVLQWSAGLGSSYTAYVAYHEGFFYRNGVLATLIAVSGSSAQLAAVEGGSVDVIGTAPENLIVAISKGLQAEAIDSGENSDGFFQFVANDTIPNSGTLKQKLAAFKGKTLGVSGLGSSVQYETEEIMSSAGLTYPADYSFAVVASGAPYLAALSSNRIQGGLVPEPLPIELIADKIGFVVDPLNDAPNQFPKQLTSGLPYANQWSLDSWASSNKAAVKGFQKAMAQAYVFMHNPKNFAKVEADALNMYGGSNIPTGGLAYLTNEGIKAATAWIQPSDLAPFENFDKQFGFISTIIPVRSLVDQSPRPPATEAQAIALAKS